MMRPHDYESNVWRRFDQCLSARIERLQRQLEQPGLSERESDVIRGQILECRFLQSRPEFPATASTKSPAFAADEDQE